jgi:hypothetical protein
MGKAPTLIALALVALSVALPTAAGGSAPQAVGQEPPPVEPPPVTETTPTTPPAEEKPPALCRHAGVRFIGKHGQGGWVCLTLTKDRKALREYGITYTQNDVCKSPGTLVFQGGLGTPLKLRRDGRFQTGDKEEGLVFKGRILKSKATGTVLAKASVCGNRTIGWTALEKKKS